MKRHATRAALGAVAFALFLVLGSAWFLLRERDPLPQSASDPHRRIESHVSLNPAQLAEMLDPGPDAILVSRYMNPKGRWTISLGAAAPSRELEVASRLLAMLPFGMKAISIARLPRMPRPPEIAVPLYLCRYPSRRTASSDDSVELSSLSLDSDPRCDGEGDPLSATPIGYASEKIRTGYRLVVRCLSRRSGVYLSLNVRCEAPEDLFHGKIGALPVAVLDTADGLTVSQSSR